jgi:mannose-6-phosphate isomerase
MSAIQACARVELGDQMWDFHLSINNEEDLVLEQIFELQPVAKNYHWGKKGTDSLVARLLPSMEQNKPYAELWYGAHPISPNLVVTEKGCATLTDLLKSSGIQILGREVFEQYAGALPFLFKVLSIAEPLSIQAHPDLTLAAKLNHKDPDNYPDCNHKPEIAIAISELELLHGFRAPGDVIEDLRSYKSMTNFLIAFDSEARESSLLKSLVQSVLTIDNTQIRILTEALVAEIQNKKMGQRNEREKLLLSLNALYGPEDPGVFFSILLRHFKLAPFQAIYTAPNVPHAYLKGDILECMATSDNVVRVGLTPKFKDATTLLGMLDYSIATDSALQTIRPSSDGWTQYRCPAREFLVEMFKGSGEFDLEESRRGPELYFCLEGELSFFAENQHKRIFSGGSVLVSSSLGTCRLKVNSGRIFRVSVPHN